MKIQPLFLLVPSLALGQQPVASSGDQRPRSQEVGNYSFSNSVEVGYRFADIGGDRDLYRASVNYGNGVRLFDGRVRVDSLDGKGLIDGFSLRSTGAPSDPYQAHSIRAEKNRVFRYDMQLRLNRYHNRLPALWRGEHGLRTDRALQTHELTLLPGSRFEVLLGYDRNRRTGPGFASEGIGDRSDGFDARNFLRFRSDLRQENKQYRAGFSGRLMGLALTVIHAVDLYEEGGDSIDASDLPSAAGNIQPVETFSRSEPFHGRTPATTVALRTREDSRIGVNARYVYSGGYRNSTLIENLTVPDPAASASTYRDTFVVGDANRDQSSGDFTVAVLPTARWAITNTTAFHNTRIEGQAAFLETGLYRNEFVSFEHLGIRRLSNATEANFRPAKQWSIYGAHRFSTLRIRSREALRFADFEFGTELKGVDNGIQAGAGGLRWIPGGGVRASFDFEVGRADRPLAPTSERRFHNESARLRWRRKALSLSGFFRRRVNDNPTDLLAYSSKSRVQGVQASWTVPESGLVLDASYSLLELDVSTGILNLFDLGEGNQPERGQSVYGSKIHNMHFSLRAVPRKGLTLSAGYALTKDTGASRFEALRAERSGFVLDGATVISSLPLTYQSPQARISVLVRDNLTWNVGWQYYGYAERFSVLRGYRAHIGFSSFSIAF